jgi:hypothetical protein
MGTALWSLNPIIRTITTPSPSGRGEFQLSIPNGIHIWQGCLLSGQTQTCRTCRIDWSMANGSTIIERDDDQYDNDYTEEEE